MRNTRSLSHFTGRHTIRDKGRFSAVQQRGQLHHRHAGDNQAQAEPLKGGQDAQPVIDPFSQQAPCISGIEFIKSELTSTAWGAKAIERATIFLPKACIEPGLAQKITDALRRYCQFKAQQNRHAMIDLRRQAFITLLFGLLFLVTGLSLSQWLVRGTLPPVLNALFSDGFVIAFWVILWRPVDFFLFELWPFWRDDRIYKRIMTMEITVAEEPATASEQ